MASTLSFTFFHCYLLVVPLLVGFLFHQVYWCSPLLPCKFSGVAKWNLSHCLLGWPLFASNSGVFTTPCFIVSLSDFSMISAIFGFQSSYMLEYHWLFTIFLRRSSRCFTSAQRELDSAPTYLAAMFSPPLLGPFFLSLLPTWKHQGLSIWLVPSMETYLSKTDLEGACKHWSART